MKKYDYVIIGSGIGGLFSAALLARQGSSVCVLEQHTAPGGYGHSFERQGYKFCAALHYIWNCGPNEDGDKLLRYLGLDKKITFTPLNPDGFDLLHFPDFSYKIVKGFDRNLEALSKKYPSHHGALSRYFKIIQALHDEVKKLPFSLDPIRIMSQAFRFSHVLRYRNRTTQDLFNQLKLPLELQAILSGQSGNLLAAPEHASLPVHAAMVTGLDRSTCVPTQGYDHIFNTLVQYIKSFAGCQVKFGTQVVMLQENQDRIMLAVDQKDETYRAEQYIYNGDPKLLRQLFQETRIPKSFLKKLNYNYSPSAFIVYLGLKHLDLSRLGFGNWNVWHYPDIDINRIFRLQLEENNFNDPFLFISTPGLHKKSMISAPLDCRPMIVCTACDYNYMKRFKNQGPASYRAEKNRITELILDQIEKHYIPDLRKHIDLLVAGTPLTMERFVFAPEGNSYGANLSPQNINLGKLDYRTPYRNLFLIGATAGIPSFAGGLHYSGLLFKELTGKNILDGFQHRPNDGLI
ncbi:MAG: NAD(P)/FAD-dependent oxidoreductase [Desulfobacterales bacterium]|nr:NAD(P)/FAD-dependent oxidoreductase [Desulfobacterales bacterium]